MRYKVRFTIPLRAGGQCSLIVEMLQSFMEGSWNCAVYRLCFIIILV